MREAVSSNPAPRGGGSQRWRVITATLRSALPSLADCLVALFSAALLIVSFPTFELWPVAWVALVPFLYIIARNPHPWRAFILGLLLGAVFFYATCYWLSYSMINFGRIPAVFAYAILIPGAIAMGLFPAIFAGILALTLRKFGSRALLLAPLIWVASEWARFISTDHLWNAIGYSQAYQTWLVQPARWGGVYMVSLLIIAVNSAIALLVVTRTKRNVMPAVAVASACLLIVVLAYITRPPAESFNSPQADAVVVAIQPNVPMDIVKPPELMRSLTDEHFAATETAIKSLPPGGSRLVIWPESPMNFTYGRDVELRERLAQFARAHQTSLILNSQEPAPNHGLYNSALLINEDGGLVAQYDKIRLLAFGEYDPVPPWFPGAGLTSAIVGEFTAGTNYRQMQIGRVRAGVFICIESAYPNIARQYASDGADVLINISNDGYLGPTAVMRQHLANAVFRAVENNRPLLRVTNTGITAAITARGEVTDATNPFEKAARVWRISGGRGRPKTFYTTYGDALAVTCAVITLLLLLVSLKRRRSVRVS